MEALSAMRPCLPITDEHMEAVKAWWNNRGEIADGGNEKARCFKKHSEVSDPNFWQQNLENIKDINEILKNPSDYIESKEYFSWEQFFTHLLVERTKDLDYMRYSENKSTLADFYKQKENAEKK